MIFIRNLSAALVCDEKLISQQDLRWPRSGADYLRRRYTTSVYTSDIVINNTEKCLKCAR